MKRRLALFLLLIFLPSCSTAGSYLFIRNPDPADRLHLRVSPNKTARSLGKYYNGAPIYALESPKNGWMRVRVGNGDGSLEGYMQERFLQLSGSPNGPASAMPQYVSHSSFALYPKTDGSAKQIRLGAGTLVSLMGIGPEWNHIMVHESNGKTLFGFVPAGLPALTPLGSDTGSINVYISNPDPKDRLHLRVLPDKTSRSLGKYYNGTIGTLMGFSEDGQWLKVDLYGRIGYMNRTYITIEGVVNRTFYGIPSVTITARSAKLHPALPGSGPFSTRLLEQGSMAEVLGVIDEDWLHIRIGEAIGFIRRNQTNFTDQR